MPTILDVARHAGVSMKTVSRVLNHEEHVRPALRDKVTASVAALGYRPNLAARQLAGQKSFILAYPFNNPSAAYVTDVLMGAARACRDRGWHLVSEPVDLDDSALPTIERLTATLRPDGIILTPPLADMDEVVSAIEALGVPLARIAGKEGLYGHRIATRERAVSAAMVVHLAALGHRRIGLIGPHPDHAAAQARVEGFRDGLAAAGLALDDGLIQPGRFDVQSGMDAANILLDLPRPPTAIFAANDDMALGALQVAHARGLAIPGDVAIAGFDDSPASSLAWPALTTVRQPMLALGATAANILLGRPYDPDALEHEIVVRASTAGN